MTPERRAHLRDTVPYIKGSVHYSKRQYDKKFEIVAVLPPSVVAEMGLHIGGEIVLDVADNRQDALNFVRHYRGHIGDKKNA